MRLFIAVDLDAATKEAAVAAEGDFTRALEAAGTGRKADVKWVTPPAMHLTLEFLGDRDAAQAQALTEALTPPATTRAFTLGFGGVGFFPESGRPNVLWLAITEGSASLIALHEEVAARLRSIAIEPDTRPYRPHLTLARFRRSPGARARAILENVERPPLPPSSITHVTLFESRLLQEGAVHVPLAQMALAS
jgi:2'-5' RNA ligase